MKITAIEVDGVKYNIQVADLNKECSSCDLRKFCYKYEFNYMCDLAVKKGMSFKLVKE